MTRINAHLVGVLAVAVTCFAVTTCVAADAAAKAEIPPVGDLPAMCLTAKAQFRPLTTADVDQAKATLQEALNRLEKRLVQDGQNGKDWKKYLKWDKLQAELQRPEGPNMKVLIHVYQQYLADIDGLDLVWFLDVQQALHDYLALHSALQSPDKIKAAYEQLLNDLAKQLEAYAAKPTTEDAAAISNALRWLEDAHQVPQLICAIEHYYMRPNFSAQLSAGLVGAGIVGRIDDTMPLRDCILGTDLHGTTHTVGETTVELAPDPDFGVIDALFFGTGTSESVGYHGPVSVYSSATTLLSARKRLWLDATGLHAYPADSKAITESDIRDIQSNKGRQFIENMAWKRAGKQQTEANCIASQHAEQRLNTRVDEQADATIALANQAYQDKYRRPFTERQLFPQELRFRTTPEALHVEGVQAGNSRLAAPLAAPPAALGADLAVRVHESMINNLAADALAGRTIHEERLQAMAIELLGHLPEQMKGDDDGQPWAITFAQQRPISVSFVDNGYTITLRGASYIKGTEAHPGMDVSATYKIEKTPHGFKAVRQGNIQVFPPDFVPGSGAKIDARRQIIRTLLEKRFAKVFAPEMAGEGFVLPGKWEAAGKLLPIQLECRDGWLVVAWKCTPLEPKPAAKATAAAQ